MFDLPGVKTGSDLETLFKAVGFVVVQWGFAEQSLDLTVATIFHRFTGDPLLKRRPQQLRAKTTFLRECLEQFAELAPFKSEGDALLTRFSDTAKTRNDLVHAAIADLLAQGGTFTFSKIDVNQTDGHTVRSVALADSDWRAFRRELLRLGKDGQSFAKRVFDGLKAT